MSAAKSRKSVIPNFTALPLLSVEAADILIKAMREAVEQVDSSKNNVVRLNGAEVDLLILYERFIGLVDASLRSQGTEMIDIFGDKERVFKARAIVMDVEFTERNAKDRRIQTMKDKCDAVEQFLEYYEDPAEESAAASAAASGSERVSPRPSSAGPRFQSRKSVRIHETLARKRRELAEGRNRAGQYRHVTWALSWLYAHRNRAAWHKDDEEGEDLPRISVKDDEGNVTVDVQEVSDMSEMSEWDGQDDDDDEEYDGDPAAMGERSSQRTRGRGAATRSSLDTANFGGDAVGMTASKKKKAGLVVSTPDVDIVSASPENLVLLMTEEQRKRFLGQSPQHSVWGQYMDLVCVRSTGDYKHH